MSRTLQYLIFYGIFFIVLYGMHLYVYWRLNRMLGFTSPRMVFAVFTLAALLFPIASLCEKFTPNTASMLLYTAASIWLGVVFLLLTLLLVGEPLLLLATVQKKTAGLLIIAAAMGLSLYGLVNALFIDIKEVTIPLRGLEKPLRIVQLSDIHVGTIHNSGYLRRIVEKTNALTPDMVFITGDLFDGIGPVNEHTVAPLREIHAPAFFVIGNHERYDGVDKVSRVLSSTGVRMLRNEVIESKGLQIVGVDFPEREGIKENTVVRSLPFDKNRPSVLMFHAPHGLDDAAQAGISLQVSGHTHNGQLFPFTLLARLFFRHVQGLHRVGDMYLYISPGTGTWGPPMRIGSRNEITLLHLVPE